MTRKPQQNAADEEQVLSAEKRQALRAERDAEDLRAILSTRPGRRFIYRKICECGVFEPNVVTNAQVYLREGQRFVGLAILREVTDLDPHLFAQMMKEATDDSP